jgi:hypothetical protein
MAVPARPVAGAPVESVWGDAVHDAGVAVIGLEATTNSVSGTAGTLTPSLVRGRGSMIVGTDIIVPVDGLYEVFATYGGTPTANMVVRAFLQTNQGGAFANLLSGIISNGVAGFGSNVTIPFLGFMSAGKGFRFTFDASASISISCPKITVALRGSDWG